MKIQEKDCYHGAAITQIVEHESFTALNKVDKKYGHYIVNHDTRLIVKYATGDQGPWQFTFQPTDLEVIRSDLKAAGQTYICMVCGKDTICVLNEEQLQEVVDINAAANQWIRIDYPDGGSMRVKGQQKELARKIPHNAFPDILFEA